MSAKKLLLMRYRDRLLALFMQDGKLKDLRVYNESDVSTVGNIYIGKVQSIVKNIGAAFVKIGKDEIGFLPLEDRPHILNRKTSAPLHAEDEVLVQVMRDAVKTKQPVLTSRLSLPGLYLALTGDGRKFGLSEKLKETKKKEIAAYLFEKGLVDENRRCISHEDISFSMIVRTNAGTLTDYAPLVAEWQALVSRFADICHTAEHKTCYSCLYGHRHPLLDDIKNYPIGEYPEIETDCEDLYQALVQYYVDDPSDAMPAPLLTLYQDEYPLSKLYSVETQLERALNRQVWLRSGGYLIFDFAEALTAIDVNTGKCESGSRTEDTFLAINLEAAEEIARQLRLRNISGIIIVDFISMVSEDRQKELLKYMRSLVRSDPVKTTVVDMTPLGLVEITRKRIHRPLREIWDSKGKEG